MKQELLDRFKKYSHRGKGARRVLSIVGAVGIGLFSSCGAMHTGTGEIRPESVYALTSSNHLMSFNAGRPGSPSSKMMISNLAAGENILGIDFRPADNKLYGLGSSGRLYTIDPATGAARQVGSGTFAIALNGAEYGFDFNPAADRIRVVNNSGQNLRLHPDTGAVVDADPNLAGVQLDVELAYAKSDLAAGKKPSIVAAAYTNSVAGAKTTTNFAIDAATGNLVTQGSRENVMPAVSPNSGQLFTVGSLGVNLSGMVAFDIAPKTGTAYAAITPSGSSSSGFYWIDLNAGAAKMIGHFNSGETIRGIAIMP